MKRKVFFATLLLTAFTVTTARGEIDDSYAPIFVAKDDPSIFLLSGPITSRTPLNFQRAVGEYGSPQSLMLSSAGGDVHAGLSLALEVNRLGIDTIVEKGCYSACFFVFSAGKNRTVSGELGVHQISNKRGDLQSGQVALSDIIDVLEQFGVHNDVLVRMLRTPSDDMYVFSQDELTQLGLVSLGNQSRKKVSSAPTNKSQTNWDEKAIAFVSWHNRMWSENNSDALSRISDTYSSEVDFYGETQPRHKVMIEKVNFANRWPVRDYHFRPQPGGTKCDEFGLCTVRGEVDWYAHSPERGKTSRGTSTVIIGLTWGSNGFVINREDGRVIQRR
ncbi:COG3904 family protein [Actibacterium pelagium]|uniref:COG3904 family protein n=1 Tax=Actibacterium pelagium TaxID=2029103 RepID=UPI001177EEF0|nr:hypothetical protein [Actibacterium pelagium]